MASDPLVQFDRWLAEADARGVYEPNAMVLGTVDGDGTPSSRTVLLRGVDDRGFVFFTDRDSRKGQALAVNRAATLLFPWYPVHRQVIVTGEATPSTTRSPTPTGRMALRLAHLRDRRAGSRSRSPRAELEARVAALEEQYAASARSAARPVGWPGCPVAGGVRGRTSRLHDRLVFTRDPAPRRGWRLEGLQQREVSVRA